MSRHTEPMTDAYIAAERMRNAARVQCSIEQLGTRWVLHPDNAVTRESHCQDRRERVEVIDTRRLRDAGFAPVGEAFQRAAAFFRDHKHQRVTPCERVLGGVQREPMLIEHDGGVQ